MYQLIDMAASGNLAAGAKDRLEAAGAKDRLVHDIMDRKAVDTATHVYLFLALCIFVALSLYSYDISLSLSLSPEAEAGTGWSSLRAGPGRPGWACRPATYMYMNSPSQYRYGETVNPAID